MNSTLSRGALAALLALVVVGGSTGLAAAAGTATISADPATPGSTSTHTVTETVGSNVASASWTGYAVDYGDSGADLSDVTLADVRRVGIDRGNDGDGATIDVNVSDDLDAVSASNNGTTLTFDFGGSYSLAGDDEVVVVYGNATNPPSEGDYDVSVDINPQSSGGATTATLHVAADSTTTSSTTETTSSSTSSSTTTSSTTSSSTTTSSSETTSSSTMSSTTMSSSSSSTTMSSSSSSTTTSSGSSPGFGVGVSIVALAGAALLARRAN